MNEHLVHKITLEVPAANYEMAKELQAYGKNWTTEVFPSLLEKSLNTLGKKDEFILIDRLEIAIPDLPWKLSDLQWDELIKTQLLKGGLSKLPSEIIFKDLIFYLKNGSFQTQSIFKKTKDLENYILEHISEFKIENGEFSPEIFDSNEKLRRLFSNFSSNFVEEIFKEIFRISLEESKTLYSFFKKIIDENSLEKMLLIPISLAILKEGKEEKKKQFFKKIVQNPQKSELEELVVNQKEIVSKKEKIKESKEKAQVYINCPNAGLVLLLPYITTLFENLNLLSEKKFRNESTQQKGVQILHYLATGNSKGEEEDLVFPKLLCSFEFSDFIKIESQLEEETKSECSQLLESVIEHWNVLKSTSVDGFRNSFLQRTGRLQEEDQNYQLEVEESGIDILLNQIPWGFRNFKLPWMEKAIITQWY